MFKRIASAALVLTVIALASGCDDGQGGNNNAAPQAQTAPATRAPQPQPLQAVFTQASFTTVYTASIANPDKDELIFTWSGPTCGPWVPQTVTCADATCTSTLTWNHASPPCPEHAGHDDTTIAFQAIGKRSGRTVHCTYKGASSGTGPTCYQNGFNATELGSPERNSAHIVYHQPLDRRCSKVDLIQVMSIVKKSSGTVVRTHGDGMDDPGANMFGYQLPLAEDDVGGYVVDKFKSDITTNDPYYSGAVSGSSTKDAELDDRPNNTREGHRARFETCAFCSGTPRDADYGKYLDCFSWEHDADTGEVTKTDPQPTVKPSPEFHAAVAKWNENKGFTMPTK